MWRMGLGGGIHCFFILEHFFWVLVLRKSFRETIFLAEVYFFLSSIFSYIWLIVGWCIVCHIKGDAIFGDARRVPLPLSAI